MEDLRPLHSVGDSSSFPNAIFRVHEACKKPLADKGPFGMGWSLPSESIKFIPDSAFDQSIGPFPRAADYFGDGSVYILEAPGHAPGHINILARTSADGAWICLAGDSCHDPRVLTGEKEIPWIEDGMYSDLESTEKHLEDLRNLRDMDKVQVLIAHDYEWYNENRESGAFFPGAIPPRT
jgi:glyoxylase-like metal-dependent hydrolase (beta-lactamase superfamily II)